MTFEEWWEAYRPEGTRYEIARKAWRAALAQAARPEDAPTVVWAVQDKKNLVVLATEDDARNYVSSFPVSVGGGMTISRLGVLKFFAPLLPQRD